MMCLSYVYDMMCGGEAGFGGDVGDIWIRCNVGNNVQSLMLVGVGGRVGDMWGIRCGV